MKSSLLSAVLCLATFQLFSQGVKQIPPSNLQPGQKVNLNINPFFTPKSSFADNPFGVLAPDFQPQAISSVAVTMGDEGLPIFFEGSTTIKDKVADERGAKAIGLAYLESLQPTGIQHPMEEFAVKKVQQDERSGEYHVRFQQEYLGVPVFGAELIAHTRGGVFTSAAGRYAPTPAVVESVVPQINAAAAKEKVIEHIGRDKVKTNWTADQLTVIGGQQYTYQLVIYRVKKQQYLPHLAWQVQAYPNMLDKLIYFVDANTGEVLDNFNASCNSSAHATHAKGKGSHPETQASVPLAETPAFTFSAPPPPPPITASGVDLKGDTRSFGAWLHTDGQRYLMDTSKPMYDAAASDLPSTRQGVIVTLDQENVLDGPLHYITSGNNTFSDPKAVSAHANAGLCYDYYKSTFNRNGIDGNGGTINVIINVPDEFGPMDNAYWNGNAIFWGNGNTYFGFPLQRALDIGGHEMTHGVVQETAGLVYQDEAGAMNESMADVFAVMIDRDDWLYSEDAVAPGQTVTGADRNFADPHNGTTDGNPGWQPSHYSERYVGEWDHGGVHANSGITNHAFYLLATAPNMTREIAEQVYYYTLRDRLTSSSKFIDLRLAVIAEATEYWNADVANAAKAAFDAVGITTGPPTTTAAPLQPGTGNEYILSVTEDGQNLDLSEKDGILITTIYEEGVLERPSVTDNGEQVVFVNANHQIMGVEIAYNSATDIQYNVGVVSQDTTWRNAAISKDGRFLAGLTTLNNNKIIIFDLADPQGLMPREYFLVNPTFTEATPWIDNVAYAEVLEFDYSGQYLAYDAYSIVENADGEDLSHWDIGLLKFWDNGQFTPVDTPQIRKLITGLPDHVGVADPAFAKNNANIIAFDYYTELPGGGLEFRTYVANTETNSNGPVVSNSQEFGYPCFTTHDDQLLFMDKNLFGGLNLRIQKLKPNHIEPLGNPANIVLSHKYGMWLNNSTRVLTSPSAVGTVQNDNLAFSVAPNPTSGLAHVNIALPKAAETQWTVANLLGQELQQGELDLAAGENQFDLNLYALPIGTYLVHLVSGEKHGVVKLVKE